MSRIGKQPVTLPQGTTVTIDGGQVQVKGKLGLLERRMPDYVNHIVPQFSRSHMNFLRDGNQYVHTWTRLMAGHHFGARMK